MANISAIKLPDGVTYDIKDDSSGYITGMTILSYGSSTWDNFIEAYNTNKVVYCRASSNSNPASGSQTRLAFMAYVNNATAPTNVEFQYYRSVSSHTASQQGDQVYVYKLDKTNGWTVTVREASVKVVAGTGLGGTYSNGTMTLTGPTKVSDLTNDSGFITGYTETDPVFSASAAAGITLSDITNWNDKQATLVSGTNIKTINSESLLGSGDITVGGTPIPTADTISEFDSDAHMNSTDMTTGSESELEDFIDGLNISGGTVETITPIITATTGSLASASITKCGHVAMLALNVYNTSSVASGGNVFEGTIQNEYKPLSASGGGVGYYGANAFIGYVRVNGTVTIRNASPSAFSSATSSSPLTVTFTYIL